ncbi:MAG: proton-conducting transporter membrane subunit [candidate division WOR-3 bacterium]
MNYNPSVLLIAIPVLSSFLSLIFGIYNKLLSKIILVITVLFNLIFGVFLYNLISKNGNILAVIGNYFPPFGINLSITYFSISLLLLLYLIFFVSSLIFVVKKDERADKISSLLLLYLASFSGILTTGDLFNMFVFIEIFSIANITLISLKGNGLSTKGSLKYLIITSIGASLFLFGTGFLYGILGTLNLAEISLNFDKISYFSKIFIFLFFLGSIMAELEVFPFNFWISDSYSGSKNFVNILLSGLSSMVALYIFVRLFITIFGLPAFTTISYSLPFNVKFLLPTIFGLSVIVNELAALSSKNVKRILGFSSASSLSLILLSISTGQKDGIISATLIGISVILSKPLLFLSSHQIMKGIKEKNIDSFVNGFQRNPFFSILFIIGVFTLIGFPLTPSFYGKFLLFILATEKASYITLITIVVIFSITIELFYYFRLIHKLFVPSETKFNFEKTKKNFVYILSGLLLTLIIIFFSIKPYFTQNIVEKITDDVFDKSGYIKSCLKSGEK